MSQFRERFRKFLGFEDILLNQVIIQRGLDRKLDAILQQLRTNAQQERKIMIDLSALEAKVTAVETVEGSAVTLLQALSQQVKDLAAGSAEAPAVQASLTEFARRLDAATQPLAAAVVANTPAEVPPPAE
jgi:hypothetical protein